MDTIEKNKIIMDFMGVRPKCERDGVYSYSDMPFYSIRENDIDKVILGIAQYSKYSFDWNWLFEVVEKIENTVVNNQKITVLIEGNFCQITSNFEYINEITNKCYSTKIESVYNACVEFIKFYNNNFIK